MRVGSEGEGFGVVRESSLNIDSLCRGSITDALLCLRSCGWFDDKAWRFSLQITEHFEFSRKHNKMQYITHRSARIRMVKLRHKVQIIIVSQLTALVQSRRKVRS